MKNRNLEKLSKRSLGKRAIDFSRSFVYDTKNVLSGLKPSRAIPLVGLIACTFFPNIVLAGDNDTKNSKAEYSFPIALEDLEGFIQDHDLNSDKKVSRAEYLSRVLVTRFSKVEQKLILERKDMEDLYLGGFERKFNSLDINKDASVDKNDDLNRDGQIGVYEGEIVKDGKLSLAEYLVFQTESTLLGSELKIARKNRGFRYKVLSEFVDKFTKHDLDKDGYISFGTPEYDGLVESEVGGKK